MNLSLFRPVSLDDADALVALLGARWPLAPEVDMPLSDPWFANLYLFREVHRWQWRGGAWPALIGRAYDATRLALPLFDVATAPPEATHELLAHADALGPWSSAQAARFDPRQWHLSASRDEADYLYPAAQFRHYAGRPLLHKRSQARRLEAAGVVQAQAYHAGLEQAAREVLSGWMAEKGKADGEADEPACREALALALHLGLEGTLYRLDGWPVGFVLAERVAPGVVVMRFAKALARCKGIYPYMFKEFCCARPWLRWLNFEQDLGVAGFRRSKLSYRPSALLPKWRVTPRRLASA